MKFKSIIELEKEIKEIEDIIKKLSLQEKVTILSPLKSRLSQTKAICEIVYVEKPKILLADWLSNHRQELGEINNDLIKEFIKVVEEQEKWALSEEILSKIKSGEKKK